MVCCEVGDLVAKSKVVGTVVKASRRKACAVSLEDMSLFDLTAIGDSNIYDTKECLVVVVVRRDLTPVLLDLANVGQ